MALHDLDCLFPQHHAQQADQCDERRGRRANLDEPVSHPDNETHEEETTYPVIAVSLFLWVQHDAPGRAGRHFAVGLLRIAEPASLGYGRGTVLTCNEPLALAHPAPPQTR